MSAAVAEPYCPDDGDIVWLDFDPQAGREQKGHRPALVLSPRAYNKRVGLCVVCPITSEVKGYPLEQPVPAGGKTKGAVLCDQVKSLSWLERGCVFGERAPDGLTAHVKLKIKALLRIP
ncbi:endoribonuclease MazF [Aerophototrophica crusticola]|uniref:Endoribonuclease MazF n=1 Tax=Aerophototrophica crusticola TaxID=1709002 RepID=A0A858R4F8_9PROT|nr:endoribonuclease MazF [Rhodospirillaceae bacterium B3]